MHLCSENQMATDISVSVVAEIVNLNHAGQLTMIQTPVAELMRSLDDSVCIYIVWVFLSNKITGIFAWDMTIYASYQPNSTNSTIRILCMW